jgi:hypothetical protein
MHVKYTEWMGETGKHDSELMNLFPICTGKNMYAIEGFAFIYF